MRTPSFGNCRTSSIAGCTGHKRPHRPRWSASSAIRPEKNPRLCFACRRDAQNLNRLELGFGQSWSRNRESIAQETRRHPPAGFSCWISQTTTSWHHLNFGTASGIPRGPANAMNNSGTVTRGSGSAATLEAFPRPAGICRNWHIWRYLLLACGSRK